MFFLLQVVRYQPGQYFGEHHDMGTLEDDDTVVAHPPRRLITLFVYLNEVPKQAGGATAFPKLKGRKRGMAVDHYY